MPETGYGTICVEGPLHVSWKVFLYYSTLFSALVNKDRFASACPVISEKPGSPDRCKETIGEPETDLEFLPRSRHRRCRGYLPERGVSTEMQMKDSPRVFPHNPVLIQKRTHCNTGAGISRSKEGGCGRWLRASLSPIARFPVYSITARAANEVRAAALSCSVPAPVLLPSQPRGTGSDGSSGCFRS